MDKGLTAQARRTGRWGARLAAALVAMALLLQPAVSLARDLLCGQGVLWRVEGGGAAPNYLFGTIHVTDSKVLDLPEPVRAAFEGARSTAFEINLSADQSGAMGQAVRLDEGRRLEDILGPELFRKAVATARKYGLDAVHLQSLKPWSLLTFMSFPPQELARVAGGQPPLDFWLQAEARRRGKDVHGLETLEEQIAVFDGLSERQQVVFVRNMIALNADIEDWFKTLLQAYLKRDIAAIQDMSVAQSTEIDKALLRSFQTRLVDERNKRMVRRLIPRLRSGGVFAAVGALHLPGDLGILRLLELQGFRVTRVY